jgi:outer membrane receptor protein involved in Fe transport
MRPFEAGLERNGQETTIPIAECAADSQPAGRRSAVWGAKDGGTNDRPITKGEARMARTRIMTLLLASVSALALPASAQTGGGTNTETVVVTGSRVITNGNTMPTPVTVVPFQDLQAIQPTSVADNLNYLPEFNGSRTPTARPLGTSTNQLNLRGLGANRNLLLFDGHRMPPTLSDGTIDADMIPQAMIDRVDVVTGGVSAVYGSEAISGVVNFVINRKLNDLKVNASGGISGYGDGVQQDVSAAYGTSLLDGRLHVEGSVEFRNNQGISRKSERPWNTQWAIVGIGTAAFPYYLSPNVRLNTASFGGLITTGVLAGQTFKTNGVLSTFVHGTSTGSTSAEVGGDGYYGDPTFESKLQAHQAFFRADYDITDSVHAYFDFSGVQKRSQTFGAPLFLNNLTLSATNAFLAPQYQAQLAASKQTTFRLSKYGLLDTPRSAAVGNLGSYFANGGVEGTLDGFHWSLYGQHGWTQQKNINPSNINQQNEFAALDAVTSNGQIVCSVTVTNPNADPGCVPINPFGPNTMTTDAYNYIRSRSTDTVNTTMDSAEFSIAGDVIDLWAGPLSAALSGEWRQLSLSESTDSVTGQHANCTGIRFNCTATTFILGSSAGVLPSVSESVTEAGIEADLPLLKDVPYAQGFTLNTAVRWTDYSISGVNYSWKLGGEWQLDDSLRLRAVTSSDIRAPTLAELYTPQTVVSATFQDLLTGLSPTVPQYAGGNPNLKSEIGRTTTFGAVWTTPVEGLTMTLDRYMIHVSNALATLRGDAGVYQLACYNSGGASAACRLQTRPNGFTDHSAANAVTAWYNVNINIAIVKTYGYDLELNYAATLFGRPLNARVLVNNQPQLTQEDPVALTNIYQAGVAYNTGSRYAAPKWQITGLVHYSPMDDFNVDLSGKWRSHLTGQADPSQVWINPEIPTYFTANLNLGYTVHPDFGDMELYLNIQNVFDAMPPPAAYYNSPSPGDYGWAVGDDPVGRYFTMGIRAKF